jgi:hypothetical protein
MAELTPENESFEEGKEGQSTLVNLFECDLPIRGWASETVIQLATVAQFPN